MTKKINLLFLIYLVFFLFSCKVQKDNPSACIMPSNESSIEEILNEDSLTTIMYHKALEDWEECLILKQVRNKNKPELYRDIQGNHIVQSILVGFSGEVSSYYLSFRALAKILTEKELNQNLHSHDPATKFHSFKTIAERKKQDVFQALKLVLTDTTQITTQYGCTVTETTLADLCIDQVTEKYLYSSKFFQSNNYQLTLKEKSELDKIVLNSNLKLNYKKLIERSTKKKNH